MPIVLGTVSVALCITMLVAWTLVIAKNLALTREVTQHVWLLVGGLVSLAAILSALVLLSVFLVREIQEGQRHTRFIDSVTHELKSPLASLSLCLQTMERSELSIEQLSSLRAMMRQDVDRLSTFIQDILDASRIGHGLKSHPFAEVTLAEVLHRCVEQVRRRYDLSEGVIEVEVDEGLQLRTDETALETIFKNVLDNAVKYSDAAPHIHITAHRKAKLVEVQVRDHGIGISSLHIKRIFDRFYRVPSEAVRTRRGTGLGLYVVRALTRNLGGDLHAISSGVNAGTTMIITLPAP